MSKLSLSSEKSDKSIYRRRPSAAAASPKIWLPASDRLKSIRQSAAAVKRKKIAVSIIIAPSENDDAVLGCLASFKGNGHINIEVILPGRTGRERQRFFREKCPQKNIELTFVDKSFGSQSETLNHCLQSARGKYLAIIHDDIRYNAGALSEIYKTAESNYADVLVVKTAGIDGRGALKSTDWTVRPDLVPDKAAFTAAEAGTGALLFCYGWTDDKLFRREFLLNASIDFPALAEFADIPFVYHAICRAERVALSGQRAVLTTNEKKMRFTFNSAARVLACFEVIYALKQVLLDCGADRKLEKSFLTWCIQFVVWFYCTVSAKLKIPFRKTVREVIEPFLRITDHGVSYYNTRLRFFKYASLCSEDRQERVDKYFYNTDKFNVKHISVWGSCISREFFNNDDAFLINGYIFQCPAIMYDNAPVFEQVLPLEEFTVRLDHFWARSVYLNFNMLAMDYLKRHPADYLIVDLADLRFHKFTEITRTDGVKTRLFAGEHAQQCIDDFIGRGILSPNQIAKKYWISDGVSNISDEELDALIAGFAADILKLYPVNRIIINQTAFARLCVDGDRISVMENDLTFAENFIAKAEKILKKKLDGCRFLPSPNNMYTYSTHRLGPFALHYCDTAYAYKLAAVKKIIYEHYSDAQIEQMCRECETKLAAELDRLSKATAEQQTISHDAG